MNPVLLVTGPRENLEAEAAAATGATGAAVSIRCPIAGPPGYYVDKDFRKALADCAGDVVVWLMAEHGGLIAGTIDVPGLPKHPNTVDACKAISDFAALPGNHRRVIVRVLSGFANATKVAGKWKYHYIDGPTWAAAADAIAKLLPQNVILSWGIDELFTLGTAPNFSAWEPTDPRFVLADCSLVAPDDLDPTTLRGSTAQAWAAYAKLRQRIVVHFEVCSTVGDILDGDWAVTHFFAPLFKKMAEWGSRALCIENDPHNFTSAKSGRYAPGSLFGGTPGNPLVVAFLKTKFASPLFIKQSKPGVPGITSASALQKAGIVTP